jgi:vitamin B12 transporter
MASHEAEGFSARDTNFFGGTDQDRSRDVTAVSAEWRARWSDAFSTDLAVRHDDFSDFADATTVRAAAQWRPLPGLTLHAAYGVGIAQPTFYDLHGFFPGSFVGNPDLRPERAEGWEAGVRFARGRLQAAITYFEQRLEDEIVDVFDPITFQASAENADGASERRGIEAELGWRFSGLLNVRASYTFLNADEQRAVGDALVREVRRPRHSASLIGFGEAGPFSWSASAAYVGEREDTDFETFPAQRVELDAYLLASLRVGYRLTPQIEAFGRVENGFDADYRDVIGYRTAGRTVHAGLRLLLGR